MAMFMGDMFRIKGYPFCGRAQKLLSKYDNTSAKQKRPSVDP